MKLKMTLMVFRKGEKEGELDLLAEFPDALAAIRAVAQLSAANSLLSHHPDVKALLGSVGPKALARMHEAMGEGVVVQIKDVVEHHDVMPEQLRNSQNAFHILAARPRRVIPIEGNIQTLHDGQVQ